MTISTLIDILLEGRGEDAPLTTGSVGARRRRATITNTPASVLAKMAEMTKLADDEEAVDVRRNTPASVLAKMAEMTKQADDEEN